MLPKFNVLILLFVIILMLQKRTALDRIKSWARQARRDICNLPPTPTPTSPSVVT
jgi:hypothetical protein